VAEIQRQRLLAAMALVAGERGAANASVAHVVNRAGVSRRTFYELFEDREACFLAAFEQTVAQAAASVVPAYEGQTRWRARIRAALAALLRYLDAEPQMGRLAVVEALGAGPRALEHRALVLATLIAAVDGGREETSRTRSGRTGRIRPGHEPPPLTAEGVVGAVFAVIHARIADPGARGPLSELLNQLMGAIVLPYAGVAAAQRELHKPAPLLKTQKTSPPGDPLVGLNMRLTYRTLRVLAEIAAHPGASNRQVAAAAEILDQGQASKLLMRLQDLGLIENRGEGHARGARNAWVLTARGAQVDRAIEPGRFEQAT
jgi:AcrR family transcriptional regulator/DNA-binding MarR family transcriptional regulator